MWSKQRFHKHIWHNTSSVKDWKWCIAGFMAFSLVAALAPCALESAEPKKVVRTLNQQLVVASFKLDVCRVRSLLARGANANARYGVYDPSVFEDKRTLAMSHIASPKWTPLLAVANSYREPQPLKRTKNTEAARDLALKHLKRIPKTLIRFRDKRRVAIAKLLIEKRAKLDLDDGYGSTSLDSSIYNGHESLSLLLLKSGANPNSKTRVYIDGTNKIAPVHRATAHATVLKAMLQHGANIHVKDGFGETALHWATRHTNVESVRVLIAAGADVNVKDKEGLTPLYWVRRANTPTEKKIAKLLESAGAK